jgi:6-phosphogluconolactonase (cycloisomerase 2 family)
MRHRALGCVVLAAFTAACGGGDGPTTPGAAGGPTAFAYVANGVGVIDILAIGGDGSLTLLETLPETDTREDAIDRVLGFDATRDRLYVPGMTSIRGYQIDRGTGRLRPLAGSPFRGTGFTPEFTEVDPQGRFLYVAGVDFTSCRTCPDFLRSYAIDAGSGALTETVGSPYSTPNFQRNLVVDPAGRYVIVTSRTNAYGAQTRLTVFDVLADGRLQERPQSPFSIRGRVRSVAPSGAFLLSADGDVVTYSLAGAPAELASAPLDGRSSNASSGFALSSSGRLALAGSEDASLNRGNLFPFQVAPDTGALRAAPVVNDGTGADAILIDPSETLVFTAGESVLNMERQMVRSYTVEPGSASLRAAPDSAVALPRAVGDTGTHVRLFQDPSGRFLYVVRTGEIRGFSVARDTGRLTELPGFPVVLDASKRSVTGQVVVVAARR